MTDPLEMTARPVLKARVAGLLYLAVIAGGLFAEIGVRQQLIVAGDPSGTAQNILANEGLFRAGLAINLAYLLCNIPFAVLFFEIFKTVNCMLARLVMMAIVVTTAIEAANLFHLLDALDYLIGSFHRGLTLAERHDIAYASLQGFTSGFAVSLTFFGGVCLLYGWLIFQSRFLPAFIGVLITLAGICYLFNSFAIFLAPEFAGSLFPFIMLPCFVGELSLALWLSVKGVKVSHAYSSGKEDI